MIAIGVNSIAGIVPSAKNKSLEFVTEIMSARLPDSPFMDSLKRMQPFQQTIPEAYFNRGNIYYNQGLYSLAIDDYSKAIELNPDYTKAYFNRGLAYKTTQQYQNGLNDFVKITSLEPNNERLIEKARKQMDVLTKLLDKMRNDKLEE